MLALRGCGRQLVVGFTCQSPDVRVLPWLFANDVEMHCNNGSIRDHLGGSIRGHEAGKVPVLDGLWFLACLLGDLHPGSSPARLKLTRGHYRTQMKPSLLPQHLSPLHPLIFFPSSCFCMCDLALDSSG